MQVSFFQYDLVFLSLVLHSYSYEDNLDVLHKVHDVLSDNGKLVVHEYIIEDDNSITEEQSLLDTLMIMFDSGKVYTIGEVKILLSKAKFNILKIKDIKEKSPFLVGRHPQLIIAGRE